MVINGIQATAGSALSITNNYQLLINSSQQFTGSTNVTNRWGIYQAGANDKNFFAGDLLIGKNTKAGLGQTFELFGAGDVQLRIQNGVTGSGSSEGAILFIDGLGKFGVYNYENTDLLLGTNNSVKATLYASGNFGIGSTSDSGRKLIVAGQQEWITPTATGSHTTSGNHLPIWVNGVQYWLALLNPPILP
jgi:hypothetical protein